MKYRTAVLIGRFQPPHLSHLHLIRVALENAERLVLCLGSSYGSRTVKNPWNFAERREMFESVLTPEELRRIDFEPLRDQPYAEQRWYSALGGSVYACHCREGGGTDDPILLVGAEKDASSYYLKELLRQYPSWVPMFLSPGEMPGGKFHASTQVRRVLLNKARWRPASTPKPIFDLAKKYLRPEVIEDYKVFDEEAQAWENTPYPVIFQTVDAVVIGKGSDERHHILLVRRGRAPGRGKYALPGGYVNVDERLEAAAIRELREETGLQLSRSLTHKTFDFPGRSLRGRVITTAFLFSVSTFPEPVAADDAGEAFWFPLNDIQKLEAEMYDDHLDIIYFMKGRLVL